MQKILVPVDALGQNVLDELLEQLAGYLTENENARVHLFTRRADYDMESRLLRKVQEVLDRMQLPTEWARKKAAQNAENKLDTKQNEPVKFVVEQCVDEISVSKCMREQRILVDFSLEREDLSTDCGSERGDSTDCMQEDEVCGAWQEWICPAEYEGYQKESGLLSVRDEILE